jgi:hypothetical protein
MILFSMIFHMGGSPLFFVALSITSFWTIQPLKVRLKSHGQSGYPVIPPESQHFDISCNAVSHGEFEKKYEKIQKRIVNLKTRP